MLNYKNIKQTFYDGENNSELSEIGLKAVQHNAK